MNYFNGDCDMSTAGHSCIVDIKINAWSSLQIYVQSLFDIQAGFKKINLSECRLQKPNSQSEAMRTFANGVRGIQHKEEQRIIEENRG